MKRRLTLRMDEETIERAKEYAADRGISVSQLVENFFHALENTEGDDIEMSPLVKNLWGTLEGEELSEEDYGERLKEKYL